MSTEGIHDETGVRHSTTSRPIRKNLVYAFQQVLAIMAATLLVPVLVNLRQRHRRT